MNWTLKEPHTEKWRWFPNKKSERAIQALTRNLDHLYLERALFTSECLNGCQNPRLIQTMGMPLPFLLILPKYAIGVERRRGGPLHRPIDSNLCDLDCALEFDTARIEHGSDAPLIGPMDLPLEGSGILALYHYTGPSMDLEDLLGAPHEVEPYRCWLAEQSSEAFQTNSIRATIFRLLRAHLDFFDERYRDSPATKIGSYVIDDPSSLASDQSTRKTLNRSWNGPLPTKILLKNLIPDLL